MNNKTDIPDSDVSGRVAIVTDALVAFGGADRLLKSLLEIFPDSHIYTSVFDPDEYLWIDPDRVFTTFIQRMPFHSYWRKHYMGLSPIGFEQFRFDEYDFVISLSAGCAKGVITRDDVPHIGIVMTPPRNQWGRRMGDEVTRRRKLGLHSITDSYLRVWDYEASFRPDVVVAISEHVKKRIKKVYKRDSIVVYPGIDTEFWNPSDVTAEDYFIIVSRLQYHKRIDIAVDACNKLERRLVIIGDGPERKRLEERAGNSIEFLGFRDDEKARDYLRKGRAFLFPGIEDFGLAPVEAMACGTPVIAYNEGGLCETIVDGKLGVLYDNGSVEDLIQAMKRFEKMSFDRSVISESAQKFSQKS